MTVSSYVSHVVAIPRSSEESTVTVPLFAAALGTLTGIEITGMVNHMAILRAANVSTSVASTVRWGDGNTFDSALVVKTAGDRTLATSTHIWPPLSQRLTAPQVFTPFDSTGDIEFPGTAYETQAGLDEMTDTEDPTGTLTIERAFNLDVGVTTGTEADVALSSGHWSGCDAMVITYVYTPV